MSYLRVAQDDLRAVLDATSPLRATGRADATTEVGDLLTSLARLVGCDAAFWNWISLGEEHLEHALVAPTLGWQPQRAPLGPWRDHLAEHPIMSGRYGPVTAISDVWTRREFQETWLYQEAFRPAGLRHEIGLELSHASDEMSVLVFSRGSGRDFTDRQHPMLRMLRPHVDAAVHRLTRAPPQLTARQAEVLRLVGEGLSDCQIARRLSISGRTVGKHLEHVYARAGVSSRVQAVALYGPALDGARAQERQSLPVTSLTN